MCSWRNPEDQRIKCRQTAVRTRQGDNRCADHQREKWAGQSDRKRRNLPPLTQSEKEYIRDRDHNSCAECGEPAHEVDHIVEAADGGTNLPSNLQLLCDTHHAKKTRWSQSARQPIDPKTSARAQAKRRRRRMGLYQQ